MCARAAAAASRPSRHLVRLRLGSRHQQDTYNGSTAEGYEADKEETNGAGHNGMRAQPGGSDGGNGKGDGAMA